METFELQKSKEELIKKATTRIGIQRKTLYYIIKETKISLKEMCGYINFSSRSVQLKKPNEKLPFEPSEKALLIARVYSKGFEVFGDTEKFISWMDNENFVLGGIKPKEYLNSYTGIELLLNEINAIDYGFVA